MSSSSLSDIDDLTPSEALAPSPVPGRESENSDEDADFDMNAPAPGGDDGEDKEIVSDAAGDNFELGERPKKRRKTSPKWEAESDENADEGVDVDVGLDSGDEATIRKGKERMERRKKGKESGIEGGKREGDQGEDGDDEDEGTEFEVDEDDEIGGSGGFVRTRGMKSRMREEQRPLAKLDGATVDVDALWAQMNAADASTESKDKEQDGTCTNDPNDDNTMIDNEDTPNRSSPPPVAETPLGDETITIKRTYKFAGEVVTEEKVVHKESAEARLYLSTTDSKAPTATATVDQPKEPALRLRRPLRKISRFDPNPPGSIKTSWDKQYTPTMETSADQSPGAQGPKLNTVQKSKLDWAAYVDREGIKDDLDLHSRAKEGYLERMDFLDRVDAKREEERKNARLKNST